MTDTVTKYKKLDQIEHIMLRPAMYIGDTSLITEHMWILDENKIIESEIQHVPGLDKIFDEIIVNAYDQSIEDQTVSVIKINIDNQQISVFNDGQGIDVQVHPKEKIYIPELIFGELLTSTHFDENTVRITGGLHGLGAKLTNIFSSQFIVETGDSKNHLSFKQTFTDNLSKRTKPLVKPYNKNNGYVRITYTPDFKYFKIKEFSEQMIKLMKRRVYDLAILTPRKVKVYLNDSLVLTNNLPKYMQMITDKQVIVDNCENQGSMGRWTVGISESLNGFKSISFVNGVHTWLGGTHANHIMSMILKGLKHRIEKKYKDQSLRDHMIKDKMFVVIISTIENPSFSSQSKDQLVTPVDKFGSQCEIDKKTIKKLYDILGIDQMIESMGANLIEKQTVTHKIKNIPTLNDAYWAGTKKSSQCTLILTEGLSAKGMVVGGLSALNDPIKNTKGNEFYGVFPLKGKLLNVRDANKQKISQNEEFVNLKKIIGLEMGKNYNEDNINELRYGSVIIFCDADLDGSHIKGLFLNMIDFFWPSLLKISGFLKIFITPIIKTTIGETVNEFFSISAYDSWRQQQPDDKYKIKYYKGLGTNTREEALHYFKDLKKYLIDVRWDEDSSKSINLAFDKSLADDRKKWLKKYDPDRIPDFTKKYITHSDFINKELIHFSNYDNERSIPSAIDGLKPSQRKILYCAFKKNLTSDIKVAQFTGYISEHASYHHGELSLAKAIISLAHNFVGSNNLNLLVPSGQFGSRLVGGIDAASPRYIYTRLEHVTRMIFDPRDDILLNYKIDENLSIEPEYYVPIIPMVLVNGSNGIGTGFRSVIPNHNPIEIIDILLEKLNGTKVTKKKNIHPWYLDYMGKIHKISNDQYEVQGVYELNQETNILRVMELPVGTWTDNYKIFLEDEMRDYVAKIKNNSTDHDVDFIIKLKHPMADSEIINKFQLSGKLSLSNMYLHDQNNGLKKYNTVHHIIDEFFDVRMRYYVLRKQSILKILGSEIENLSKKLKFIELVISNRKIFEMPHDTLIDLMVKQKIIAKDENDENFKVFLRLPFQSFTLEKTKELKALIEGKKQEYQRIEIITPGDMWKTDLIALKNYLLSIQ